MNSTAFRERNKLSEIYKLNHKLKKKISRRRCVQPADIACSVKFVEAFAAKTSNYVFPTWK